MFWYQIHDALGNPLPGEPRHSTRGAAEDRARAIQGDDRGPYRVVPCVDPGLRGAARREAERQLARWRVNTGRA